MNYQALYQLCQRQSGNKDADALLGFKLYLNMGQRELAAAFDNWLELHAYSTFSLVQGTESYAFATDLNDFRTVWISSPSGYDYTIDEINYQQFREKYGATGNDGQGPPKYRYFDDTNSTNIKFFPIPDQSYTVSYDYVKVPADMSADTDTPFFPARWHHILVDYALAYYYESPTQRNFDAATRYFTKFQNDLEAMRSDIYLRNLKPMPIRFGSGVNEGYGPGIYPYF